MRLQRSAASAALVVSVHSQSLSDVCTTSHVQASLPANNTIQGIEVDISTVTASPVYNASTSGQDFWPDYSGFEYCNVTFAYSHIGKNDKVNLQYWLPAPTKFQKRFLATGGGGYAINSGSMSFPGGVIYGAAAGSTDGGFGGFNVNFNEVVLASNGSINYDPLYMFAYKGIAELTKIGKSLTKSFFGMNGTEKLYTYYQGCSEGGREGWSQVQRYGEEYDGVIPGAPAFRFSQQQVQHLYSNVVEKTQNYFPPSCELDNILNETIAFCDPLDGVTDGVVSRSDLCQLNLDLSKFIGTPYYCAASSSSGPGFGFGRRRKRQMPGGTPSSEPEQNGTISAEGVKLVQTILDGLHTSDGKRAYISYQPGAGFSDASTKYNNATGKWELSINSMGGEFITKFIQEVDISNLPSLDDVTYDTLVDWMQQGMIKYTDTLQTTLPDLTAFQSHGGKVLTYHGEADDSIPAGSSVHYHESVRQIMYANQTFNESQEAMGDWYRLFLIPGAAHCSPNTLQPNGPFPQTNLQVLINWVEKDVKPETLNATVLNGGNKGQNRQICAWPLRPLWNGNGTSMECVYDQESVNTWMYNFDAYKLPLY